MLDGPDAYPIAEAHRIAARRQELAESGQLTDGQATEMEMQLSVLEAFGRPLQERMARENAQRKEALDRFGLSGMEEGAGGEGVYTAPASASGGGGLQVDRRKKKQQKKKKHKKKQGDAGDL